MGVGGVQGFVYSPGDIDPGWSLAPASLARWTVAAFHRSDYPCGMVVAMMLTTVWSQLEQGLPSG